MIRHILFAILGLAAIGFICAYLFNIIVSMITFYWGSW